MYCVCVRMYLYYVYLLPRGLHCAHIFLHHIILLQKAESIVNSEEENISAANNVCVDMDDTHATGKHTHTNINLI